MFIIWVWSQRRTEWPRFQLWFPHRICYLHSTGNIWGQASPVRRNSSKSLGAPWKNIFSHQMTTCQQLKNILNCWIKRKRPSDAFSSSCLKVSTIIHSAIKPFTRQRLHAIGTCIEISHWRLGLGSSWTLSFKAGNYSSYSGTEKIQKSTNSLKTVTLSS